MTHTHPGVTWNTHTLGSPRTHTPWGHLEHTHSGVTWGTHTPWGHLEHTHPGVTWNTHPGVTWGTHTPWGHLEGHTHRGHLEHTHTLGALTYLEGSSLFMSLNPLGTILVPSGGSASNGLGSCPRKSDLMK